MNKLIFLLSACCLAFSAFAAVTRETEWHDIPDVTKVKDVVDLAQGGGGCDTNTVDALANSAVVTNALTVATTNRVALLESSKADNAALDAHVANTNNPHAVTAEQVGAVPFVKDSDGNKTAVTIGNRNSYGDVGSNSLANGYGVVASGIYSHAEGNYTTAFGDYSHAEGGNTTASGAGSHTDGINSQTRSEDYFAFAWNGDSTRQAPYTSHGAGTFNINPAGGLNGFWIGEQTLYTILTNKADNSALEGKVSWDSEHSGVSLGDGYLAAGPYSSLGHDSKISYNATIYDGALIGNSSEGSTFIGGFLHFSIEPKVKSPALFSTGNQLIYTTDFGNNVLLYFPSKSGTIATTDDITNSISETNTVFSKAVLAVNVDFATNTTGAAYVAVTNALAGLGFDADALAELPGGKVYGSVGALLAALAAAAAWLKKNKVGSFDNVGGATATVENGVAKLDNFFTESNSLLTGTIATKSIPAFSSSSTYEVEEIVIYDGVAYKCVTAITTAEEWTAAHWTLATNSDLAARLKGLKSDGTATDAFVTSLLGKPVAKEAIDEEIIEKGTAPDAHIEAPTDEHLKLILADNSVAYDSAKALPYKLTSVIGNRVIATMTLNAASTDITLPTISANDTTVKDFILDVTNAYAVEGVATDAGINIPRTDFKLVTRDGESLTDVTTVKAGKSAFICFTQKSPVVVDGTTYPCWCVIQLPFGDPS